MERQQKGGVSVQRISTCTACGAAARSSSTPVPTVAGQGRTLLVEALTVKVPQGVEEGMALRVPAHGMPSREAGGSTGDLFVVIRAALDPRFERCGADLWRDETIQVAEAALGTELSAPTLDGEVTAKVPAGTQPDTVLRLRGEGLPHFGSPERGDLFLRMRVQVPEKLSSNVRALYEKLWDLGDRR